MFFVTLRYFILILLAGYAPAGVLLFTCPVFPLPLQNRIHGQIPSCTYRIYFLLYYALGTILCRVRSKSFPLFPVPLLCLPTCTDCHSSCRYPVILQEQKDDTLLYKFRIFPGYSVCILFLSIDRLLSIIRRYDTTAQPFAICSPRYRSICLLWCCSSIQNCYSGTSVHYGRTLQ